MFISINSIGKVLSYRKFYDLFTDDFEHTHSITFKNHMDDCLDIDELIGFNAFLRHEVWPDLKIYIDANKLSTELLTHQFFLNNLTSCYASTQLTLKGLYIEAQRNFRPVLESFLKMFYLVLKPQDFLYVYLKDYVGGVSNKNKIDDRLSKVQKITNPLLVGINKDQISERFSDKEKYTKDWYIDHVYIGAVRLNVKEYYDKISTTMHSSAGYSYNVYNEKNTDVCLKHIKVLLFYNIVAILENWFHLKHIPLNKAKIFLNETLPKMGTFNMIDLIPNHLALIRKLHVRPRC